VVSSPRETDPVTASREESFLERVGLHPAMAPGYLGLLLFMTGDGVESGFLAPYLSSRHLSTQQIAYVFTVYGVTAAIAAWFSGALSDLLGPRKVMWIGFSIWVVFELLFLTFGLGHGRYPIILLTYGLRGFGYPFFAFGFLVWITAATPARHLGAACGYFWFAFTGGLPTLGSLFASFMIPRVGQYQTFWLSLGLVLIGGLIALLLVREPTGGRRLAQPGEDPVAILLRSISIAWKRPKIGIGGIVRAINTTTEFGFLVFMPAFFIKTIGFSLQQWLHLLSVIFASNVLWNLLSGIVADMLGWRRTITYVGGVGCCLTTLALYYVPAYFGANYPLVMFVGILYGFTLAGYVPLSALMPTLAPDARGAAMSILNLGAGVSVWFGPGVVALVLPFFGVKGVMWAFAGLYILSAILSNTLTLPEGVEDHLSRDAEQVAPLGGGH
jgi:polyol permease family